MNKLEQFKETYQKLTSDNLEQLHSIYAPDIIFIDPVHEINGIENLTEYFSAMYQNVDNVRFEFGEHIQDDFRVFLEWDMNFRHSKLNGGKSIIVHGGSLITFNERGLVSYHRDFFDLGALLYEQLPLLGTIIRSLKGRLAK